MRGVDRQRRLADAGHPAERVNPQDRAGAIRRCRHQLPQFGLPAGEAGHVARQGPGGRCHAAHHPGSRHRVDGGPATGGGLERGPGRAGQPQRVGQQPGGVLASGQVVPRSRSLTGEWIFDPDNGTYQFDAIYDSGECGYQSNGTYQVHGNSIYFRPQDESAFSEIYSFDGGTLVLCDVPDTAECNHYNQPVQ